MHSLLGKVRDCFGVVLIFGCLLLGTGCASYTDLSTPLSYLFRNDFPRALQSLETHAPRLLSAQGPIIVNYDLGMLSRLNKDYERSNTLLSESERLIREAYTKSITQNLASFILNDNTREYPGEEYEDLYLNLFKALNYLAMGQTESALVELSRSLEKQTQLQLKYEQYRNRIQRYADQNSVQGVNTATYATVFSTSALTNYLTYLVANSLRERSTAEFAKQQVQQAFSIQPTLYPFPIPSVLDRSLPDTGLARLHLVGFTGLIGQKEERWEYARLSRDNFFKIAYPVLVWRPSSVAVIRVKADDGTVTDLELIESIGRVASDTFRTKSELQKLKSVVRAVAKSIGVALYDQYARKDNKVTAGEELLSLLLRVGQDLSERADIRSVHFLPSEAWVGAIDVKPGIHSFEVTFLDVNRRTITTRVLSNIEVKAGSLNLADVYAAQ